MSTPTMKEQVVTLRVRTCVDNYNPASWQWSPLVGDEVEVLSAGPVTSVVETEKKTVWVVSRVFFDSSGTATVGGFVWSLDEKSARNCFREDLREFDGGPFVLRLLSMDVPADLTGQDVTDYLDDPDTLDYIERTGNPVAQVVANGAPAPDLTNP